MTKAELKEYIPLKRMYEQIQDQIEYWESLADKQSPTFSDMPKSHNYSNKLEQAVEKISELQDRQFEILRDMAAKQLEIENAIQELPYREQTLMRYKYIMGLSWEQIAVEMNYTYRHICRVHGDILQKMS